MGVDRKQWWAGIQEVGVEREVVVGLSGGEGRSGQGGGGGRDRQ